MMKHFQCIFLVSPSEITIQNNFTKPYVFLRILLVVFFIQWDDWRIVMRWKGNWINDAHRLDEQSQYTMPKTRGMIIFPCWFLWFNEMIVNACVWYNNISPSRIWTTPILYHSNYESEMLFISFFVTGIRLSHVFFCLSSTIQLK